MISFKVRLFVSTIAIVSAVSAVVVLLGWSRIMQFEVDRMDTRLCIEAKRIGKPSYTSSPLPDKLTDDLASKMRVDAQSQLMWMTHPDGLPNEIGRASCRERVYAPV